MLGGLSIRNVLLIDQLDLNFEEGLGVLTGETGAGKSILLDALGLALGERASPSLIRTGETQATVTAEFDLSEASPIHQTLKDLDLTLEGSELLLRRVLTADGKSRAFMNDQSISLTLLKKLGESLVEIHGQFDQLLNASTHRRYLDNFGQLGSDLGDVQNKYQIYKQARQNLQQAQADLANRAAREAFLQQALQELEALALKEGEEEKLLQEREYFQHYSKIMDAAQSTYSLIVGDKGIESMLGAAHRHLDKVSEVASGTYKEALGALDRATIEIQEVLASVGGVLRGSKGEVRTLEIIDDRLHTLRSVARKHFCTVENLRPLQEKFQQEQDHLVHGSDYIQKLEQALQQARQDYISKAQNLRQRRHHVAKDLEAAIKQELTPLKLDKAALKVQFVELEESAWGDQGFDRIEFQVQTNPGMAFGSFGKIASGGERARIMLALKVILAQESCVSLLIFDEIDTGVGGAVASAIGERLSRLGQHLQLLTVTHSPQVASYADFHWRVSKQINNEKTLTKVVSLSPEEREEEIARMLAGERITEEARAAARRLLVTGQDKPAMVP
ncbi:MAG: DNA repair protein RecN [Janthinobacterium lividum]